MGWIQTYSGETFDPCNPDPSKIHIEDIAHALSLVCRYGGHCKRFYSVAEHSVLMSLAVDQEYALWALLHDATEAYIGDMMYPLKENIPLFCDIEYFVALAIADKFGLMPKVMPFQVADYDRRIVVDEKLALMNPCSIAWPALVGVRPLGVEIQGWPPYQAEMKFLHRYSQLTAMEDIRNG